MPGKDLQRPRTRELLRIYLQILLTRHKVAQLQTHLMIEFRRTFGKPDELPKFDFEQGAGSEDSSKTWERNLNRSSVNDDIPTEKQTYWETWTHDTSIHTTVRRPVIHET